MAIAISAEKRRRIAKGARRRRPNSSPDQGAASKSKQHYQPEHRVNTWLERQADWIHCSQLDGRVLGRSILLLVLLVILLVGLPYLGLRAGVLLLILLVGLLRLGLRSIILLLVILTVCLLRFGLSIIFRIGFLRLAVRLLLLSLLLICRLLLCLLLRGHLLRDRLLRRRLLCCGGLPRLLGFDAQLEDAATQGLRIILGLFLNLVPAAVDLVLNVAKQFINLLLGLIAELLSMQLHAFAELLVAHEITLELLLGKTCMAFGALDLPRRLEGGVGCALGLAADVARLILLVAPHLRIGLVH
mmetsp:Transcript_38296/g.123205  ORF Transcript_38296/g.123205 Transcript_38296/m.123205 type:complete len:301 (+) Transcript_38296:277-1179(+)